MDQFKTKKIYGGVKLLQVKRLPRVEQVTLGREFQEENSKLEGFSSMFRKNLALKLEMKVLKFHEFWNIFHP